MGYVHMNIPSKGEIEAYSNDSVINALSGNQSNV